MNAVTGRGTHIETTVDVQCSTFSYRTTLLYTTTTTHTTLDSRLDLVPHTPCWGGESYMACVRVRKGGTSALSPLNN